MKSLALAILSLGLLSGTAYAEFSQDRPTEKAMPSQEQQQSFLTANKKKPGITTLPDGLQYKVITAGKGARPTDDDMVTVHYEGKLINGTEFDSSYKRGEPATFPVKGVIPGWVEALKLMKAGSTWELYIPASLAYGEQGSPPVIGPNQTLIFKVNLIDIKKLN
jgi:FKBP-type peptidyl-prolyl cis-trans isomerase FklB